MQNSTRFSRKLKKKYFSFVKIANYNKYEIKNMMFVPTPKGDENFSDICPEYLLLIDKLECFCKLKKYSCKKYV